MSFPNIPLKTRLLQRLICQWPKPIYYNSMFLNHFTLEFVSLLLCTAKAKSALYSSLLWMLFLGKIFFSLPHLNILLKEDKTWPFVIPVLIGRFIIQSLCWRSIHVETYRPVRYTAISFTHYLTLWVLFYKRRLMYVYTNNNKNP